MPPNEGTRKNNKTEKNTNKMDISNLSDKECKDTFKY